MDFRSLNRRLGVTPNASSVGAASVGEVKRYDNAQSLEVPLGYQFPDHRLIRFGFTTISAAAPVIDAGTCAWYGMCKAQAVADVGQECYFTGYKLEMMPPDAAGTGDSRCALFGGAVPLAWGEVNRYPMAYVVIGPNLPCVQGQWTSGPIWYPGLTGTAGTFSGEAAEVTLHSPGRDLAFTLPPGNIQPNSTTRKLIIENKTPLSMRLTQRDTLDAALVLPRSQINGQSGYLTGYVFGQLTVGMRYADRAFTE